MSAETADGLASVALLHLLAKAQLGHQPLHRLASLGNRRLARISVGSGSEDWVAQHLAFGSLAPAAQELMEERGVATAVAMAVRGVSTDHQPAVLEAVLELPNREAQLARIADLKELQRQGVGLDDALAAAPVPPVAVSPRLSSSRSRGRPRLAEVAGPAFSWWPVDLNGHDETALLYVTFGHLEMVRRGRLMRQAALDAYLDALSADLAELREACRGDLRGGAVWEEVQRRLSGVMNGLVVAE